jgi:hypothetical protein
MKPREMDKLMQLQCQFFFITMIYSVLVSWLCWSVRVKRDASLRRGLKSITSKLVLYSSVGISVKAIFFILFNVGKIYRKVEMWSISQNLWLFEVWCLSCTEPNRSCAANQQLLLMWRLTLQCVTLTIKANSDIIFYFVVTRCSQFWP